MQLQDYTNEDIRSYCWAALNATDEPVSHAIASLIPEIIGRAEGVFLWVKLVMNDLIKAAEGGSTDAQLALALHSIPLDLKEYYARIVQRIPQTLRRDAYVIFEVMVRSRDPLHILELMLVLELSRCPTFDDLKKAVLDLHETLWPKPAKLMLPKMYWGLRRRERQRGQESVKQWEKYYPAANHSYVKKRLSAILSSTGNLVELVQPSSEKPARVQFAHQTVKESICKQP
ncbi:hypothetical protein F4778DRAFT_594164 [Xylariomycetidae sp. FL2044]|nr:hypothetical protein F4778DRAFT_594164 [Xylariomycetidae sp. FL2044]